MIFELIVTDVADDEAVFVNEVLIVTNLVVVVLLNKVNVEIFIEEVTNLRVVNTLVDDFVLVVLIDIVVFSLLVADVVVEVVNFEFTFVVEINTLVE